MASSRNQMCARLSALGWRQNRVHHMIDTVEQWRTSSGDEWAVNRLKAMKQHLIHQACGIPSSPEWISLNSDGSFKGAFRCLSLTGPWKQKVRTLNTIMVYSDFVSSKVTERQWEKFQRSAETPEPSKLRPDRFPSKERVLRLFPSVKKGFQPASLDDFVLSTTKRAPSWDTKKGRLVTILESDVEGWLPSSVDNPSVRKANSRWPELFVSMKDDIGDVLSSMPSVFRYPVGDKRACPPSVGKVSFIQEPGFKLRAVANPNRILQCALEPLRKVLFDILKRIPRDCTYDQSIGTRKVERWLAEGKTVHSIDLSDATNNFPLDLQISILRHLLPQDWTSSIELFEYCATEPWRVLDPSTGEERNFRWTKGQPLGLGPSFASFAISHHFVAQAACGKHRGDYVILGDDIAMVGDEAAFRYRSVLDMLGCPVSGSKTISSDRVAEFAGKLIFREEGSITPYKWRGISDHNFVDLMRNLGPQAIGLLRPRQRRVARAIAEIPEDFGGLGWNPRGLSYAERVDLHLKTIRVLEKERATTPMSVANRPFERYRSKKKLTTARWYPFGEPAKAASPARPVPVMDPVSPLVEIHKSVRPHESEVPDSHRSIFWTALPDYKVIARDGDPRGTSMLDRLEDKLDLSDESGGDQDLEP